jgi:hypothetical protein
MTEREMRRADRDSRRAGSADPTLTTAAHVLTAAQLRIRQLTRPQFGVVA